MTENATDRPELFHRIAERESARARRRVAELALEVAFRNVEFEGHARALAGRGGNGETPALWDGGRLHVGLPAVLAALDALAGRSSS